MDIYCTNLGTFLIASINNCCITSEYLGFLAIYLSCCMLISYQSPPGLSCAAFWCLCHLFYLFMCTAIDKQCYIAAITSSERINYSYTKSLAMIQCLKKDKHKCKKQILIDGRYKHVHIFSTLQRWACKIQSLEEIWIPNAPQALPVFAERPRLTFRKWVLIFPQSLPLCSFAGE